MKLSVTMLNVCKFVIDFSEDLYYEEIRKKRKRKKNDHSSPSKKHLSGEKHKVKEYSSEAERLKAEEKKARRREKRLQKQAAAAAAAAAASLNVDSYQDCLSGLNIGAQVTCTETSVSKSLKAFRAPKIKRHPVTQKKCIDEYLEFIKKRNSQLKDEGPIYPPPSPRGDDIDEQEDLEPCDPAPIDSFLGISRIFEALNAEEPDLTIHAIPKPECFKEELETNNDQVNLFTGSNTDIDYFDSSGRTDIKTEATEPTADDLNAVRSLLDLKRSSSVQKMLGCANSLQSEYLGNLSNSPLVKAQQLFSQSSSNLQNGTTIAQMDEKPTAIMTAVRQLASLKSKPVLLRLNPSDGKIILGNVKNSCPNRSLSLGNKIAAHPLLNSTQGNRVPYQVQVNIGDNKGTYMCNVDTGEIKPITQELKNKQLLSKEIPPIKLPSHIPQIENKSKLCVDAMRRQCLKIPSKGDPCSLDHKSYSVDIESGTTYASTRVTSETGKPLQKLVLVPFPPSSSNVTADLQRQLNLSNPNSNLRSLLINTDGRKTISISRLQGTDFKHSDIHSNKLISKSTLNTKPLYSSIIGDRCTVGKKQDLKNVFVRPKSVQLKSNPNSVVKLPGSYNNHDGTKRAHGSDLQMGDSKYVDGRKRQYRRKRGRPPLNKAGHISSVHLSIQQRRKANLKNSTQNNNRNMQDLQKALDEFMEMIEQDSSIKPQDDFSTLNSCDETSTSGVSNRDHNSTLEEPVNLLDSRLKIENIEGNPHSPGTGTINLSFNSFSLFAYFLRMSLQK